MTGLFTAHQDLSLTRLAVRMVKAAKLNADTFRELRDDPSATLQSIILIPIVGMLYGAGLGIFVLLVAGLTVIQTILFILLAVAAACLLAAVWSGMTFLLVTRLFRRTISYTGLTRPFFIAWSPGVLFILMLVPYSDISTLIRALVAGWIIVSSIYAVKHAAGLMTQQSILVFILSAFALGLIQFLVFLLLQMA